MCGICGIIDFNGQEIHKEEIVPMMQAMKHRGPDDEGVFIDQNHGFGFVRLSIIDLSMAGHQPMADETGRYTIVFNGEIYNYIELREELEQAGVVFRSKTDTEVLLKAYILWGAECLHKLNGMFAFTIYDKAEKSLFGARDRFGIKPFYYTETGGRFLFASEIPPILTVLNEKPTPNEQAIFDYLVFNRTDQTESTFFSGIKKLQHGHSFTIKDGRLAIHKWYNLATRNAEPFENVEEYRRMLSSSIGLRLRSDVPVGVCLSGGLDSSSIVSLLLEDHKKNDINTFSAVYGKSEKGDESEFIDEYKVVLPNMHRVVPDKDDLFNDLHGFIRAHAEPMPTTSPFAQYKVMELAKGKVVVTLDGQGADEKLAGYPYFFGFYFKDLLKQLAWGTLLTEMAAYRDVHKSWYGFKTFAYFMLPKAARTKLRTGEKGYLDSAFQREYSSDNSIAGNLYASGSLREALLNHFEYKLEHLLKWSDRNSMFFSIESRTPFLDYRLVEKTLASPDSMKIKRGVTKYILRESLRGILPDRIRERQDKVGFGTPESEWFRSQGFMEIIQNTFQSERFKKRGIINPDKVLQLYKEHLTGKADHSKDIWKCLNLELWYQEFID